MRHAARAFRLALCLSPFVVFAPLGCNSAGGQAAGTGAANDLSGPPVPVPPFAARLPRKCATVTKPPSAAQAVVLAQCQMEGLQGTQPDGTPIGGGGYISLTQDIKIEMGAPRAFIYRTDAGLREIDVAAKITPLRGSFTSYFCSPVNNMYPVGHNCMKSSSADVVGWCWKTTFGDYKCMLMPQAGILGVPGYPAPTTY